MKSCSSCCVIATRATTMAKAVTAKIGWSENWLFRWLAPYVRAECENHPYRDPGCLSQGLRIFVKNNDKFGKCMDLSH